MAGNSNRIGLGAHGSDVFANYATSIPALCLLLEIVYSCRFRFPAVLLFEPLPGFRSTFLLCFYTITLPLGTLFCQRDGSDDEVVETIFQGPRVCLGYTLLHRVPPRLAKHQRQTPDGQSRGICAAISPPFLAVERTGLQSAAAGYPEPAAAPNRVEAGWKWSQS